MKAAFDFDDPDLNLGKIMEGAKQLTTKAQAHEFAEGFAGFTARTYGLPLDEARSVGARNLEFMAGHMENPEGRRILRLLSDEVQSVSIRSRIATIHEEIGRLQRELHDLENNQLPIALLEEAE